jgi:hypothetical protein
MKVTLTLKEQFCKEGALFAIDRLHSITNPAMLEIFGVTPKVCVAIWTLLSSHGHLENSLTPIHLYSFGTVWAVFQAKIYPPPTVLECILGKDWKTIKKYVCPICKAINRN